jgi:hypothetical protein
MRVPLVFLLAAFCTQAARKFDVAVYGATAGGTIAAIAAAEQGMLVALLEPAATSAACCPVGWAEPTWTRRRTSSVDSPANSSSGPANTTAKRSPGVSSRAAERILNEWLKQTGVQVMFNHRLASVTKRAGRIVRLRTTSGEEIDASIYIDASYEGDLMKIAGVSYAIGRDSRLLYDESLAGRQDFLPGSHQFRAAAPASGPDGKLLPYIQPQETIEPTGSGSRKFQSYCFRICLTRNAANRLPLPRPEGYDTARFELARLPKSARRRSAFGRFHGHIAFAERQDGHQ